MPGKKKAGDLGGRCSVNGCRAKVASSGRSRIAAPTRNFGAERADDQRVFKVRTRYVKPAPALTQFPQPAASNRYRRRHNEQEQHTPDHRRFRSRGNPSLNAETPFHERPPPFPSFRLL
ncbi:hypothetical protein MRX96_022879 [Rhipicephalus microplus]